MSSNSPRQSHSKKIRLGQKKLNVFARKTKPITATNSSSSYLSQETGSLYHPHFQPLPYHQNTNRVQNTQNPPFQTQNSSSGGTSSSHQNAVAQSPALYSRREMIRISGAPNTKQQHQQELPLRSESSLMMSNSKINSKKDRLHNNQFSSNINSHNHQIQKRIDTCSKISDIEWQSNITTNHTQHQGTKNQSFSMNDPDNHIVYQHNRQLRASIEVQQKDINDIASLGKFQQHLDFQSNNFYSINSPPPPIPKSQNHNNNNTSTTSRKIQHEKNVSNKLKKIANIQASQRQASSNNAQSPMHRSLSQPRNFVAHQFGRNSNHHHQQSQKFSQQQQQQIDSHRVINSHKMNYPHQKSQSQHANRRIAFQSQKRVPSQNVNQTAQDILSPSRKFGYRESQSDSDRLNFFAKSQNHRSKGPNSQAVEEKEAKSKRSQEDLFQSNGRPRLKVQKSRKSVGLRKTPSNSKLQQNSIISNQGSINQGNVYSQVQSSKRGLLESRQSKFNRAIQPKNQSSSRTKTHLKSVFNSKEQQSHQANNITIATSVPQNNSNHSISHNFQFQTHQHQQIQNSGSSISHPHHSYVKKLQNSHTSRPSGSLVKSVGKIRQPDYIMQKQNYVHANNNSVTTRSSSPNSRKKMIKHRSKTSFTKDQSLSIQNGTHLMMNDIQSVANPNHEFKIDTPKVEVLHTSKARRPSQILSFNQDQTDLKQQIVSGIISTTSKKSQKIKFSRQPMDGNKNSSQPGTMIYPGSTKAS